MATKPTIRIPVWASGGTTTDPGAGKEATGWVADDRPPANWWNWILNSFGQWVDYFSETQAKAFGRIWVVSNAASLRSNSLGIGSVALSSSSPKFIEITWDTAFSDTDYTLIATAEGAIGQNCTVFSQTTTKAEIELYRVDTGANVDPEFDDCRINIVVFSNS